jgi:hypothetical protein
MPSAEVLGTERCSLPRSLYRDALGGAKSILWCCQISRIRSAIQRSNRTHAPSSLQNIRLSSDVANLLSRSQNWRADGDGCVLALLNRAEVDH